MKVRSVSNRLGKDKVDLDSLSNFKAKLITKIQMLYERVYNYDTREHKLRKSIKEKEAFLERNQRPDIPDFIHRQLLPDFLNIATEWYELAGDPHKWFARAIMRDGQTRRQWCVLDIVKLFNHLYQHCKSLRFDQRKNRAYLWDNYEKEYVTYKGNRKEGRSYLQATRLLGRAFNRVLASYKAHVCYKPQGHAKLLREKGLDICVPYAAFNFEDYTEHMGDFVKPIKMYDVPSVFGRLNKGADTWRKKRPRYYKVSGECLNSSRHSSTGSEHSGSSDTLEDTGLREMYPLSTRTTVVI